MKNLILGLVVGVLVGAAGVEFIPQAKSILANESEKVIIDRIANLERPQAAEQIKFSQSILATAFNMAKRNDSNLQKVIDEKRFRSYIETKYSDLMKEIDAEQEASRTQVFQNLNKHELLQYEKFMSSKLMRKMREGSKDSATKQRETFDKRRTELVGIVEKEAREIQNAPSNN